MRYFKIVTTTLLLGFLAFSFEGCKQEEEAAPVIVNRTSIAPPSSSGRPNTNVGCVEISSRSTTISVWDKGTVDGDIISLIANGQTIISNFTLAGPSNKKTVTYDFGFNGYNYLVLYAHNEGSISPNTAAISINGKEFQIDSYLTTNGYVDIIVTGFDVFCSAGGGSGGGSAACTSTNFTGTTSCNSGSVAVASGVCCPATSPFYCAGTNLCYATCEAADAACTGTVWKGTASSGGATTGQAMFWTRSDFSCGNITVNYGGTSAVISSYYSSGAPACGASGCATFTKSPGVYNYTASCTGKTWSGQVTVTAGGCFKLELIR